MDNIEKYKTEVSKVLFINKELQAKKELLTLISKRNRTSFIFAIDQLEKKFGHLWGHNKPEDAEFTEAEDFYYNLYEQFRKCVLDNGNNQIRSLEKDLDGFRVINKDQG